METRVDEFLAEFSKDMILNSGNIEDCLQKLFDNIRITYNLDMVFLMENDNYVSSMHYSAVSVKEGIDCERHGKLYLTENSFKELLYLYDDECIADKHLDCIQDSDEVLHYGLVSSDFYYGCVGFRSIKTRIWSNEERNAISRLGRALFFYLVEKRAKSSKKERMKFNITTIAGNSVSDYVVDLKNDTCHAFKINPNLKGNIPEWSKYSDFFEMYVRKYVDAGFDIELNERLNLNALRMGLKLNTPAIACEYRRTEENRQCWFRATASLVDVDENNEPWHAVISIEDITSIIPEREKNYYAFRLLKNNYLRILTVDLDMDIYSAVANMESKMMEKIPNIGIFSEQMHNANDNYIHPNDIDDFCRKTDVKYLKSVFAESSTPVSIEYRRLVQGKYEWVRLEFVPHEEFSRGVHTAIAYMRNISDEMAAREERNKIIASFTNLYFSVLYIDLSDRHYQNIAMGNKINLETAKSENLDAVINTLVNNEIRDEQKVDMLKFLDMDTVAERMGNKKCISIEYYSKYKGWCRITIVPVQRNIMGMVTNILLAISNIDDEKEKENAYKRELQKRNDSLERQMEIIRCLSDSYYAVYYVDLSDKSYEYIDTKRKLVDEKIKGNIEIYKTLIDILIEEEFRDEAKKFADMSTISARMKDCSVLTMELKEKNIGWCRIGFVPVRWNEDGELLHMLFTIQIIDADKKRELDTQEALKVAYEDATKANSAKTDFLSRMSHDIRTPMNAIIGMTEIAKAHIDEKKKVMESLDKITSSSQILLGLINEVLDVSKIEAGKIELYEEEVNLNDLMDNLATVVAEEVNNHKHTLTLHKELKHNWVMADSNRLQRIFLNILSNAIKYTPDGGKIDISVKEFPILKNDMGMFEFEFTDNGMGMSKEYLNHIYEPFSREQNRTGKIQGTGLGMPIVFNLVHIMNGDMKVISEIDKGSTFCIRLPLRLENSENHQKEENAATEEQKDFGGIRVLVAEDQEFNREIAQEFLEMFNIEVVLAEDGRQAVKKVEESAENEFALIFMDIQMPFMNGYDATRAIRALDREDVKSIPIVAMTANAFVEDINSAFNSGMNDHISKPIDTKVLSKILNKWIRRS